MRPSAIRARRTFMAGIGLFALASLAVELATSPAWMCSAVLPDAGQAWSVAGVASVRSEVAAQLPRSLSACSDFEPGSAV